MICGEDPKTIIFCTGEDTILCKFFNDTINIFDDDWTLISGEVDYTVQG